MMQQQFRALRFAGATLAADDYTLILPLFQHVLKRLVGNCENVRLEIAEPFVLISVNVLWIINRKKLVRVDSYENLPDVGVNLTLFEALVEFLEQRLLVQIWKSA